MAENPTPHKNVIRELIALLLVPLKKFKVKVQKYISTSLLVLLYKGLPAQINENQPNYHRDTNYAIITFEFILIFLFISKVLEISIDTSESFELIRDLFSLIFFFVSLLIFVGIGRVWKSLFKVEEDKRVIDAFFVYEFNLLFLPSYFILYFTYFIYPDNDEAIGGMAVLLASFWIIHLFIYFFKYARDMKLSIAKSLFSTLTISVLGVSLLLSSIILITGASISGE